MNIYLRRKLLEARRTESAFEAAKDAYFKTCQKLQAILNTWDSRGQEQIDKNRKQLDKAYASISRKAEGFILPALEKVLKQWGLELESVPIDSLQRTPGAEFTVFLHCFSGLDASIISLEGLEGDFRGRCKRFSSTESGGTLRPTPHAQGGVRRCYSTSRARGDVIQDHHATKCTVGEFHCSTS